MNHIYRKHVHLANLIGYSDGNIQKKKKRIGAKAIVNLFPDAFFSFLIIIAFWAILKK